MAEPGDPPDPPPEPRRSGSVDVQISEPELPAVRPVRKRATTASVITGVADRVVSAAEAIGGKVGDVVGESLSHLPVMPKTRRGRVLARSVLVSFCLVFAWISVIVGLQLRGRRPPDLRPDAEHVLVMVRDGHARELYKDEGSASFQEVELEDTFVAKMEDLNRTLGRFIEINGVVATETNRGPGGRTARIDLLVEFERTATKGTISFRWENNRWMLLGLSIEVPKKIVAEVGTPEARRARVQGNVKEFTKLLEDLVSRTFAGQVDEVWREAAPGFLSLEAFRRATADWLVTLGQYHRVLSLTSARITPGLTGASVDAVIEFDNATIKGSFQFTKIDGVWRVFGYKLVLPLPQVPS